MTRPEAADPRTKCERRREAEIPVIAGKSDVALRKVASSQKLT